MSLRAALLSVVALPVVALPLACSQPTAQPGTLAAFDLDADLSNPQTFYELPYPSDLRLDAAGHPDLKGFPNPTPSLPVAGLQQAASEHPRFPVVAASYFHFAQPLAARDAATVIAADKGSPVLLVDVDEASPERGHLFPTVAATIAEDDYVPANLLAVAPRPGVILPPHRTFAVVVRRSLNDAAGKPLGVPLALAQLAADVVPQGAKGAAARELYRPLWKTLEKIGVPAEEVAAATVFTTGDVVEELAQLGEKVKGAYQPKITDLALDTDDGDHPRFCELKGHIRYPAFQKGKPPFDTDGLFVFGADGLPVKQGEVDAPVTVTLPKGEMPAKGFPLMVYFHGSGGTSSEVVDRGYTRTSDGEPTKGEGPAHVVAPFGLASASAAMPVNPERLPGASDFAYLNLNNLPAFRDTFRQGVLEQRLFIEALRTLEIAPEALAGCPGPKLAAGQTAFRFDPDQLVGMGQSMGGMYANMVSATEPRIRAVVPTGAGGYWSYFILDTPKLPDPALLGALIGTREKLTYLHPVLQLAQTAWETAEPYVFTPRLARRPLAGHPVRPIYEPVGSNDAYFRNPTFDAIALAYGNQQAGSEVWPSMQQALALEGRQGLAGYPVAQNRSSESGTKYTGVVVQYPSDGIISGHSVAFQLDEVKYQYGCFLSTFLTRGVATVPAPAPLGTPCP